AGPEPAHGAREGAGRRAPEAPQRTPARGCAARGPRPVAPRLSGGRGDAPPGRGRRLHRLLRLDPPRDERGTHAAPGEPPPPELQARPDRVPRAELLARAGRRAGAEAVRSVEGPRRGAPPLRSDPRPRLRARGGVLRRAGERAGAADGP